LLARECMPAHKHFELFLPAGGRPPIGSATVRDTREENPGP